MTERPMKQIPISAAKDIADRFGYDQVVIFGRRVGEAPDPCGEHMTTYGLNKAHCAAVGRIGNALKKWLMGWGTPTFPRVIGTSRVFDNDKAVLVLLAERPDDTALRDLDRFLKGEATHG